jgi:hypothetical protein
VEAARSIKNAVGNKATSFLDIFLNWLLSRKKHKDQVFIFTVYTAYK